ncbi:hypothetical protein Clacol_007097 [Clathrus columnatus]|uniref:Cytochrome P450 n=1 Tax=Clathrus columnatus TaxID=1419009 RepID=A0AAV5AGT9_9AGAM|nr:hypothetical protein Clacol_007097 [Clathrus columnatus]
MGREGGGESEDRITRSQLYSKLQVTLSVRRKSSLNNTTTYGTIFGYNSLRKDNDPAIDSQSHSIDNAQCRFQNTKGIKKSRLIGRRIPYISPGRDWSLVELKHELYKQISRDVMSWVQLFPTVRSFFILADPFAIKEMMSNRALFPKNIWGYKILNYFGPNVLTSEGEEWKHQRKLISPAFSEKNNRLVWEETMRVVQDMFNHWGPENEEIPVDHCLSITLPSPIKLKSGFGQKLPWSEDNMNAPFGHEITFKAALTIVSQWAFLLSKSLRDIYSAKEEFVSYMKEMIEKRRGDLEEERYDLFNMLLKMNEENTAEQGTLAEDELLGNIFIFLFAGYETTAHTICFALGLLAIEQEEQEKLFQHIVSILGDRTTPNYEELNTLSYVIAVINETLRLFAPIPLLPKVATEDTTISIALADGKMERIFIQSGTMLYINTTGLHYNPKYWDEPHTFNPSRFRKSYNKDAFIPFSGDDYRNHYDYQKV